MNYRNSLSPSFDLQPICDTRSHPAPYEWIMNQHSTYTNHHCNYNQHIPSRFIHTPFTGTPMDDLDASLRSWYHQQHLPPSYLSSYQSIKPTLVLRDDDPTPLQKERRVSTPSPISIPSVMGLIMPDPNTEIYTSRSFLPPSLC